MINWELILDDVGELVGAWGRERHGGWGKGWRRDGRASVVSLERIAGMGAGNGGG